MIDKSVIYVPDYLIILNEIDKGISTLRDLHIITNIAYSHLHKLKKTFYARNWITITRDRQKHILKLTDIGKNIIEAANALYKLCDINKDELLKYKRQKGDKKMNDEFINTNINNEEYENEKEVIRQHEEELTEQINEERKEDVEELDLNEEDEQPEDDEPVKITEEKEENKDVHSN